jgi:type IV pilus assembly protein PilB
MTALEVRSRLGQMLVDLGHVTPDQLADALRFQQSTGGQRLLGEVLVERGLCSEEQLIECVARQDGVPFVKLDSRLFDPATMDVLPREFLEAHAVLPLFRVKRMLTVATAEPANLFLIDEIRRLSGCDVQVVAATAKDIRKMLQAFLPAAGVFVIDDIIDDADDAEVTLIDSAAEDIGNIEQIAGQSPVIRLVNYIIYHAVKEQASDIHIEPAKNVVRVRYRIDGTLHKMLEVPSRLAAAVTSRIKIMSNLDISERRLPQDGRIHVVMQKRPIDLRVSICPMVFGEKTVIRVLDNSNVIVTLGQLGFRSDILERFKAQIDRPNGIVLVTGPTGSGKTTTLYAALNEITSMDRNICTVEDPVEYHLNLINQVQVRDKIGLSFSASLRSLLRQDPDVIMLGEIRDEETARIAIQAALTGHLVFSTLHTNDAPSAVTRLVNMSVEPYLLSAAVNAVLAQRLVRRVCAKCREPYTPSRTVRNAVAAYGIDIDQYLHGVGCKRCRNTGYSGRIGIHELLVLDDGLRDLITQGPPVSQVRAYAKDRGMTSLRFDGLTKVKEGLTTVEEVLAASTDV